MRIKSRPVSLLIPMRLGILGWDRDEYESQHLVTTSRARGHEAELFTLDDVSWGAVGGGYGVRANGRAACDYDVIVSRAQLRRERWQSDLERLTLLSNLPGTPILDPAAEFVAAESKFVQHQRIAAAGLPVLPTVCCASESDVRDAIAAWGDTVLKPSFGLEGNDVERIWARQALPDTVTRLLERYGTVLAQPYVPNPQGDLRLTVVDGEVVLSFRRIPQSPGWKANVAQGARAQIVRHPPAELAKLALRASLAMDITIAGVDLMPLRDGHVIVEINDGPGWHPLTEDAEAAMAHAVIAYAERVAGGG
jgi:ribosomal protein S6--L-glutamate ligase